MLRCISRWELLQQISSGMPTDAVLFSQPEARGMKAVFEKAKRLLKVRVCWVQLNELPMAYQ